jgi:hypothetical protein
MPERLLHSHDTTRESAKEFSWNLMLQTLPEYCGAHLKFIYSGTTVRDTYMQTKRMSELVSS